MIAATGLAESYVGKPSNASRTALMAPPVDAAPKKGGLFGKFSGLKTSKSADPSPPARASPSPVIRDLHPVPLHPSFDPKPTPKSPALSSTSGGTHRSHTISTASTLANSTVGTPLGTISTASSGGSSGIEAKQSPVPPFGAQRKLFFPITVLAASVQKKAFTALPTGQDAHSQAGMSMFANAKGDWKKRFIVRTPLLLIFAALSR